VREFEGFIPDLLETVSRRVNFNYIIEPVRDGKYGAKMLNGSWNGMIGELTRRVSYARETVSGSCTRTVQCPSVCPCVFPFRSTVAATGGFAAEFGRGQQILIDSRRRPAALLLPHDMLAA